MTEGNVLDPDNRPLGSRSRIKNGEIEFNDLIASPKKVRCRSLHLHAYSLVPSHVWVLIDSHTSIIAAM